MCIRDSILAHRYRKLVRCCAHPYFLAGGDSEDLLQEGMFGLIKAMREFRADREASFQTFAEVCIRSRLCSVIRASRAGKHSPLNESVPLKDVYKRQVHGLNRLAPYTRGRNTAAQDISGKKPLR